MASNNQKTGPLDGECRACHDTKLPFKAEQKPVKMGSKSLHYLHVSSKAIVNPANSEENCGVCHHVYDEKLNKLVWEEGTGRRLRRLPRRKGRWFHAFSPDRRAHQVRVVP